MKHFVIQLTVCSSLLLLIFCAVALLSNYQYQRIHEIRTMCEELPATLENEKETLKQTMLLEEKLKKAGTSLAFFTHYEQLNAAYLAADTLRASIENGSGAQYGRALCELREALGTLERNERLSLEIVI
jgi:2-methylisocitrate lyase-like PEP mutase family enzyme